MKELRELVSDLSMLHGISSREDDVADYMRKAFSPFSNDIKTDILGNVICHISCGRESAKKLLVFAHSDELGMIIHKIENNGFLRATRVGGVSVNVLPGTKMDIIGKKGIRKGIVGITSHHVTPPEEKGRLPALNRLYIDAGFTSKEQAEQAGITVGCFCTYSAEKPIMLGEELICGKAMDNRACCAGLIAYAHEVCQLQKQNLLEWDIYIVACVQEELNVRGILPVVTAIQPDASIGLDIAVAADTPDLTGSSDITLGGGPCITYFNFHGRGTLAGVLPDKALLECLENVCEKNAILFQREVIIGIITENAFISFHNQGIPVANISIACRYTHTPVETVHLGDLSAIVGLLTAFTKELVFTQAFGKNNFV